MSHSNQVLLTFQGVLSQNVFPNQFHIIASIEKIVHKFLWLTIERVHWLCYWFGNIFNESKKVSDYIRLNCTIVF